MKFTIITSIILLIFSQARCQNANDYNLSAQIRTCDTETVLLTMIRSNRTNPFFKDLTKVYDLENHEFIKNRNTAFVNLNHQFNRLSKDQKILVLHTIHNWCDANNYLKTLVTKDIEFTVEAILYSNRNTRKLFNKFIVNKNQDWTSLSTYEGYELNIAFLDFVDHLNPKEKIALYNSLNKTKKGGRKN